VTTTRVVDGRINKRKNVNSGSLPLLIKTCITHIALIWSLKLFNKVEKGSLSAYRNMTQPCQVLLPYGSQIRFKTWVGRMPTAKSDTHRTVKCQNNTCSCVHG